MSHPDESRTQTGQIDPGQPAPPEPAILRTFAFSGVARA